MSLDQALQRLAGEKVRWTETPAGVRAELLGRVRSNLGRTAPAWAELAARQKGLEPHSPLTSEEWWSGPWTLLAYVDVIRHTLQGLDGARYLDRLPVRRTRSGQTAVQVFPASMIDRILWSGISAEVWMEPGVTAENLRESTASIYRASKPKGRVRLVLGAGNITSIAPLDALHGLLVEDSVVLLKLNPITDYLKPILEDVLAPFIERSWLLIVSGGAEEGAYLAAHPLVDDIHVTGSAATYEAIRRSLGAFGDTRRITSELGAVCPTLVVPGPWSARDLRFQAQHVATQKLHNSGFNCVASQVVVVARSWPLRERFIAELRGALARAPARAAYYPNTSTRLAAFRAASPAAEALTDTPVRLLAFLDTEEDHELFRKEVFGPALCVVAIDASSPQEFLEKSAEFANNRLMGSLGANIIVDPTTESALGMDFERLVTAFRYGVVGINVWTGLAFLIAQVPWGAFPGHVPDDIQSGSGFGHNGLLFDRPQRTLVRAPFHPFPRSFLHGNFTILPKPPWFLDNKTAARTARRFFSFQYRPSIGRFVSIFASAVRG